MKARRIAFPPDLPTLVALIGLCCASGMATCQERSLVSVDESPTALMLMQRVLDQSGDNVGEAARGCQELLSRYGARLLPASPEEPDRFISVRSRVESILLANPELLDRFRELQAAEAERLFVLGDRSRLIEIAGLTRWGLDASLAEAQRELESGAISHARRRLEGLGAHPDLEGVPARHRLCMLGFAAHLRGDDAAADELLGMLMQSGDPDGIGARLAHLRSNVDPIPRQSIDTLDTHDVIPPEEVGWHQVWSDDHPYSLFSRIVGERRESGLSVRQRTESDRLSGRSLVSCPLVTEDTIFVSDGTNLHSYDRYSAGDGWTAQILEGSQGRAGIVADLAEVAVDADSIFVMPGFAYATTRSGEGDIVCLERRTGVERWRTNVESIDPIDADERRGEDGALDQRLDLSGAFPYGGITVSGGTVVFPARKVNSRRETLTYLVGLNAATGEVRWVRMIGSSAGVRTQRGFSRPIEYEGSVIIASPVGVAARVDATTGEIIWLRRFPVPLSVTNLAVPWEIPQPAVLGQDLYLLGPEGTSVLRFDVVTGDQLDSWPTGEGTTWGAVRYLLADPAAPDGGAVYAVGSDVVAMSGSVPGMPRWRFSESAADEIRTRVDFIDRNGTRGRVHAAGSRLLLPGAGDLLVLDARNGQVLERIPTDGPSNPVLVESQILLGRLDGIVSLMQLGPAEKLLRGRIAESPGDPLRPLGLLELGLQSGRPELALEAAEMVDALLEGEDLPDVREGLVSMLLRLLDQTAETRADLAERAVEIATSVATTDSQVANVLLAAGDLALVGGSPEKATEIWLEVLSQPGLARVVIPIDEGLLSAAMVVRERISDVPAADHARIMARLEALCRDELQALDPETPEKLSKVATTYLDAPSALDAWRRAARMHESAGDAGPAVDALLSAARVDPEDTDTLIAIMDLQNRAGWNRDASRMLESILETPALRAGFLGDASASSPRSVIGLAPGDGFEHPGRLVGGRAVPRGGGGDPESDGLLTVTNRMLEYRLGIESSEPAWTAPVNDRAPRVLREDEDALVVWTQPSNSDPLLIVLARTDGEELWRLPSIENFLPAMNPVVAGRRVREGMMPGGRVFSSREVVPIISADSLVLVRRGGDVAAIDLDMSDPEGIDPATALRWRIRSGLDRIYHVISSDRLLMLGGVERVLGPAGDTVERPRVEVLERDTGRRIRFFEPLSGEGIRWMAHDPAGRLVLSTRASLEAHDLLGDERVVWFNESPQAISSVNGWMLGDRLLALSEGGLVAFMLSDGGMVPGAFALSDAETRGSEGLVSLERDSGGVTALFDRRLVRFDLEGRVTGMDALPEVGGYMLQSTARGLAMAFEQLPRSIRDGFYRYRLHLFDTEAGLRLAAPPMDLKLSRSRLISVEVREGHLVLSTSDSTVIIPMNENLNPAGPLTDG